MSGVFLPIFSLLLLGGMAYLSYLTAKPIWPFHAGGKKAYLLDLVKITLLPILPLFSLLLGYRIMMALVPETVAEFESKGASTLLLILGFVGLLLMRFLPYHKAARGRVEAARIARLEALKL
jgi:hypothetical protein